MYASRATRFARRFAHVACFAEPAPASFADFERVSAVQRGSHDDALAAAGQLLQSAKALLDRAAKLPDAARALEGADADLEDIRSLARVAVANRVNLARASSDSAFAADLGFHESLPVLS